MEKCLFGLIFIFLCSSLGVFYVIFSKRVLNDKIMTMFLGFAGGVMLAASIWSLLIPSIELAKSLEEVVLGTVIGISTMLVVELLLKITHKNYDHIDKMYLAVTIHNMPEGLIVGLTYGLGVISGDYLSGLLMAIAIGLQNIPEGIALSVPIYNKERKKIKTLILILISAIAEPLFGFLGFLLFYYLEKFTSVFLSFAAGIMIFVVFCEFMPLVIRRKGFLSKLGFIIGFLIMMLLDIFL
ncbi:MAG: ZIP family metal transporter [Bacilli bacterium]|nr:ZIP family metal transporter [Bacilli bacterium]